MVAPVELLVHGGGAILSPPSGESDNQIGSRYCGEDPEIWPSTIHFPWIELDGGTVEHDSPKWPAVRKMLHFASGRSWRSIHQTIVTGSKSRIVCSHSGPSAT